MEKFKFAVPVDLEGQRLDLVIAKVLPSISRSLASRIIKDGGVLVNGKTQKPSRKVCSQSLVEVLVPEPPPLTVKPEEVPLNVLFEDESISVIDKPAGMTSHPAPGLRSGTLVNALLNRFENLSSIGGPERRGIVHRLDKETSGVMVVAKTNESHLCLASQFGNHKVMKVYLAIVAGHPAKEGTIEKALGRHIKDRKRISSKTKKGKEASTTWKVVRRAGPLSLVEVKPRTGRTHQIRVHLSEAGFPVVGDKRYGLKRLRDLPSGIGKAGRHMLHAHILGFEHPKGKGWVEFRSEMPFDMVELIERAKKLEKLCISFQLKRLK